MITFSINDIFQEYLRQNKQMPSVYMDTSPTKRNLALLFRMLSGVQKGTVNNRKRRQIAPPTLYGR